MTFAIVAGGIATALGASASTAALVGAGAGLLGSQILDGGVSDAQGSINNANAQANQLAHDQFEYQKEIQAPYQTAGTGALDMISTGLGIAPQVETRDQIRARLRQQGGTGNRPANAIPTSGGVSQYNNPIQTGQTNGNGTGNPFENIANGIFPQINNSQRNAQIRQSLGLDINDNSQEAQQRINAYVSLNPALNNTNNTSNTLSDADLEAQVEAEYLRQQQANTSATGSAGFGEFNKDFTAADFDVNSDPGAKFRQDEALKALSRTYSGSGNFFSGGALKGFTKYNQDFSSQEFGNAYDRFNNDRTRRFNRLATVAGIGQTANQATGNASQNYANNVGENITNTGSANASAQLYGGRQLNNNIQRGVAQYATNPIQPNNYGYGTLTQGNYIPMANTNLNGYADLSFGV